MSYFIYPYKYASKGAKTLAKALGGTRLKAGLMAPKPGDVVINWGAGDCPPFNATFPGTGLLNKPVNVRIIANKAKAFVLFKQAGVSIPTFATTREAVNWKGKIVVRHKLTGHSGEGIEIVDDPSQLPVAPLYVEYIKKEDEYRVHIGVKRWEPHRDYTGEEMPEGVFRDDPTSIIAVQRKARRLETPDAAVNWQVRNHANGFVFVRNDVSPPPPVLDAASRAIIASGLDFGAVDVIWNAKQGVAYVLEINTAPGIEGTTIDDYANFFRSTVR